ncbi:hypothetical protein K443DRAFT_13699 [Laccaria amethystina LaAM-08-1]|uniref:Uncharacterized protein n=1 Tax=Laccaria amethystina LaAM-08-1 TaxID=1095629 RepID=A0A0C9WI43_9AGAR|nr:hypothetical protein K443DRAFT_13699 [Laccaria amethystina LaAM-08-1]
MQISDEVGRGGGREGEPGCEASRGWTAGGGTRAASSQLGSTSDDGRSSRERVARREAAAIADDKNMTMQVQNGVENHPDLKRAMLSKPRFTYDTGLNDWQCLSRVVHVQNVKHQGKRKSQRTSFKKRKCDNKHSPIRTYVDQH